MRNLSGLFSAMRSGARPCSRARAGLALAAAAALAACGASTEAKYAALQTYYSDQGLMRTETDPPDAPFDNADLIRNFERIAFFKEFATSSELREELTSVKLVKWNGPISYNVSGDAVTARDIAEYDALIARLSALTGLEFVKGGPDSNIVVMIASPALRLAFVDMMRDRGKIDRIQLIEEWSRNDIYPCVGQVGWSGKGDRRSQHALIAIKAETAGVLRQSCIHEELIQTLGLLNDDRTVRPSIFNDDQEFALMTRHDEYLLRILYDPRLRHGMSAREGMPIVRRIVAEIGPDADGSHGPRSGGGG